ncbi:MAG: hypothetical protein ACLU30_20920 [Odoribacter splanchnicus]
MKFLWENLKKRADSDEIHVGAMDRIAVIEEPDYDRMGTDSLKTI